MARKTKKRKITAWNRKFGAAAKACFAEGPHSGKELGKCMRASLKGGKRTKRAKSRKRR